jgi:hypothetical protein
MKTTSINSTARFTGLAVALALVAGLTGAASAADLIKGGERQLNLLGIKTKAVPSESTYVPMSCLKCKDEYSTRVDWSARGAHKPTVLVARHLCDGCDTTIATVGHGKQARDVATHKCTSCGAESLACCSTKKGGETATKGMEKKFEVAPLK